MRIVYISEDGKKFDSRFDCEKYEKELEKRKEEEFQREVSKCSNAFLLSVGFDVNKYDTELQKNQILGCTWLIFDKYGDIKGLKTSGGGLLERYGIKCDFRYISSNDPDDPEIMENWLRTNQLYGHALSSFKDRHPDFYKLDMLGKLRNLDWEVKNGQIVGTW